MIIVVSDKVLDFCAQDGFGGGNNISANLLFQTCGESGDHAAINTWDRQGYLTDVATAGHPSFVPAVTEIHGNFIVSDGDADGGNFPVTPGL